MMGNDPRILTDLEDCKSNYDQSAENYRSASESATQFPLAIEAKSANHDSIQYS
jgi:hypothetical protein